MRGRLACPAIGTGSSASPKIQGCEDEDDQFICSHLVRKGSDIWWNGQCRVVSRNLCERNNRTHANQLLNRGAVLDSETGLAIGIAVVSVGFACVLEFVVFWSRRWRVREKSVSKSSSRIGLNDLVESEDIW